MGANEYTKDVEIVSKNIIYNNLIILLEPHRMELSCPTCPFPAMIKTVNESETATSYFTICRQRLV